MPDTLRFALSTRQLEYIEELLEPIDDERVLAEHILTAAAWIAATQGKLIVPIVDHRLD